MQQDSRLMNIDRRQGRQFAANTRKILVCICPCCLLHRKIALRGQPPPPVNGSGSNTTDSGKKKPRSPDLRGPRQRGSTSGGATTGGVHYETSKKLGRVSTRKSDWIGAEAPPRSAGCFLTRIESRSSRRTPTNDKFSQIDEFISSKSRHLPGRCHLAGSAIHSSAP